MDCLQLISVWMGLLYNFTKEPTSTGSMAIIPWNIKRSQLANPKMSYVSGFAIFDTHLRASFSCMLPNSS